MRTSPHDDIPSHQPPPVSTPRLSSPAKDYTCVVSADTGEILRDPRFGARLQRMYPTSGTTKNVSCYNGWFAQVWFQRLLGGTLHTEDNEIPDLLIRTPDKENYFFELKSGNQSDGGAMIKKGQLEKFLEYPNCFYAIAYHKCAKPKEAFETMSRRKYNALIEPVEVYIFPVEVIRSFYESDSITEKPKRGVSLDYTKALRACRARELFQGYDGPCTKRSNGSIHTIGFELPHLH